MSRAPAGIGLACTWCWRGSSGLQAAGRVAPPQSGPRQQPGAAVSTGCLRAIEQVAHRIRVILDVMPHARVRLACAAVSTSARSSGARRGGTGQFRGQVEQCSPAVKGVCVDRKDPQQRCQRAPGRLAQECHSGRGHRGGEIPVGRCPEVRCRLDERSRRQPARLVGCGNGLCAHQQPRLCRAADTGVVHRQPKFCSLRRCHWRRQCAKYAGGGKPARRFRAASSRELRLAPAPRPREEPAPAPDASCRTATGWAIHPHPVSGRQSAAAAWARRLCGPRRPPPYRKPRLCLRSTGRGQCRDRW